MKPTSFNIRLGEDEKLVIKYEKIPKGDGEFLTRRYMQGRLLGRGGFAKVYQFTCIETSEIFAAKVISRASLKDDMLLQKFKAEVGLHKALSHPNIVKFDHYFEDSENIYILLELCTNESMSKLLQKRKRLTEIEVQCYLVQILDALKFMHQRKVLHRDLKLANLLLDEKMQLKVADFGLAAKLHSDSEKRKTACGTPNFMAPEVLNNSKGYSYPIDIWSLGVICFNLLTGKLPFEANTSKEIYAKIEEGKFTFPISVPLSSAAKDLVTKMLTFEPEKRITLSQIEKHAFLNQKNTIPHLMPTSTLTHAPPQSFTKQYEAAQEPPKLGALFQKAQAVKKSKEQQRYKSLQPKEVPVMLENVEKKAAYQTPHKRVKTKADSSGENSVSEETRISFNKENIGSNRPTPVKKLKIEKTDDENLVPIQEKNNNGTLRRSLRTLPDEPLKPIKANAPANLRKTFTGPAGMYGFNMEAPKALGITCKVVTEPDVIKVSQLKKKIEINPVKVKDEMKKEKKGSCPFVKILHWVDYTAHSGLGYTLSDGSVGVMFNDESNIVMGRKREHFYYVRMGLDKKEMINKYRFNRYPADIAEKVACLERFDKYFEKHNQKAMVDNDYQVDSEPMYVKSWLKTKHAALFRMSTDEVQVVFIDCSMLKLSATGKEVVFMNKKGEIRDYNLEMESLGKDSEVKKRLIYTTEVLEKIWNKKGRNEMKPLEEIAVC